VKGLLTQVTDDDTYAAELEGRRVTKYGADDARERRVDQELLAAGVTPGDASMYGSIDHLDDEHDDDAVLDDEHVRNHGGRGESR
jgi:hypothetical protein